MYCRVFWSETCFPCFRFSELLDLVCLEGEPRLEQYWAQRYAGDYRAALKSLSSPRQPAPF